MRSYHPQSNETELISIIYNRSNRNKINVSGSCNQICLLTLYLIMPDILKHSFECVCLCVAGNTSTSPENTDVLG